IPVPPAQQGKPVLTAKHIEQLAVISSKIERHYGKPQDIEWAIHIDKLYIVQSRPITTLGDIKLDAPITFAKTFTREESLILCELVGQEFDTWLRTITPTPPPSQLVRIH